MLKIRTIRSFGFPILHVSGSLDLTSFGKLLTEIADLVEQQPRLLGLDLGEVTWADAAAVSVVTTAAEWLAEHGGQLRLLDTSPAFDQAIQVNRRWLRPHTRVEIHHQAA